MALNTVDDVALNTVFDLRFSATGRTVGRSDSQLDGRSVGRTDEKLVGKSAHLASISPFIWFDLLTDTLLTVQMASSACKRRGKMLIKIRLS